VMLTFCAAAGKLSAAIASNDKTAIQAGLEAAGDFLVLNMCFSSFGIVDCFRQPFVPRLAAATSFLESIQSTEDSCPNEVTMLSNVVDNCR